MLKTTGLALVAMAFFTGAAAAQDARPGGRTDQDGDRRVSLAEMQARAAERFARLDVNRDDQLTREERRAGRQAVRAERAANREHRRAERDQRRTARLSRLDTDRDGQISRAEAPPRLAERFARLDADRNGRLSATELQRPRAGLQARRGEHSAQGPRVRRDGDGDGVVTRAEFQAAVTARFTVMDGDRDGFVTRQERRVHRQARRA